MGTLRVRFPWVPLEKINVWEKGRCLLLQLRDSELYPEERRL
jgi:hypothetical protein